MRKLLTATIVSLIVIWSTAAPAATKSEKIADLEEHIRDQDNEIRTLRGRVAAMESELEQVRKKLRRMEWEPADKPKKEKKTKAKVRTWLRVKGRFPSLKQWQDANKAQRNEWCKQIKGQKALGVAIVTGWERGYWKAPWDNSEWNLQIQAQMSVGHGDSARTIPFWLYTKAAKGSKIQIPKGEPIHFRGRMNNVKHNEKGISRIGLIDCDIKPAK